MRRMIAVAASAGLLCIAAVFAPSSAFAAKPKVEIADIKGSIAFMAEGAIKNALKKQKSIELVTTRASVLVTANTERTPKGWVAEISVRSGDKVLKTWSAKAKEIRKLTQAIEKNLWKQLGATILKAARAAEGGGGAGAAAGVGAVAAEEEAAGGGGETQEELASNAKGNEREENAPGEPKNAAAGSSRGGSTRESSRDSSSLSRDSGSRDSGSRDSGSRASESDGKVASTGSARDSDLTERSSGGDSHSGGSRSRSQSPLIAQIGVNYFTRSLRYTDDLFGQLRPYTLSGAPAPVVSLAFYPAAFATDGFAAHLGLGVHVEYAIGLKSEDSANHEYPTKELELYGALRGRIPIGAHEVVLSAGAGTHGYSIDNASDGTDPDVPAVNYTFLRVGVDARFELVEAMNLTLIGAYRPVLSAGEIKEDGWFKNASAGAVDVGVRVSYEIVSSIDLIIGGDMRRYFYTLNPEPGDLHVAGGALDQYFSGTLAIGWTLR